MARIMALSGIQEAASRDAALSVLRGGGLVAIPTETVYGLAADATNGVAVAQIYAVKGRPDFNPLIIHCSSLAMAEHYAVFSDAARGLGEAYWPGPLTLVLPFREGCSIAPLVTAGLPTVALRVPKGGVRAIIEALDRPLAAPSANLSGRLSPTTADHVAGQIGDLIPLILDGGACAIGLESTILSLAGEKPVLLRPGGIAVDVLEATLARPVVRAAAGAAIEAPGMMASHYAPKGMLRLDALRLEGEDGALNFGGSSLIAPVSLSLSERGDLHEAAANLFAALAEFDRQDVRRIAVAPIPLTGLGEAINDRLQRAAAPRETAC